MKEKLSFKDQCIGFVIGALITAAILKWYNYILISKVLPYWQFIFFGMVLIWMENWQKWIKYPMGIIFFAALISQLCGWFGLVSLPYFK